MQSTSHRGLFTLGPLFAARLPPSWKKICGAGAARVEKYGAVLRAEIAFLARRLDRAMAACGARLGENDNWIAATALYYGEPLVTNDADFNRVAAVVGLPLKVRRD